MARLTAATRNALPSSAFADPKNRKYPMEDKGHREAAMGRVAQHGNSKQKAAVHKRFGRNKPGGGPFAAGE